MSRIWHFIRRIALEIYCFLTAPLVIKNCLGMVTFAGLLLLLTTWWLKCYTDHGQSVEVPNFVGMTYKEAVRNAKSRDFRIAITDSVYLEGKAPGEVINQSPKPKSAVKENRTIYLTIVKSGADLVTLPNLTGNDDFDLYSRQCARLNIKTRISARVPDTRLEPNTILAVIHRADTITHLLKRGYKAEMGATLDFVVTEKANNESTVPDLLCLTYDEAQFILGSGGMSFGQVIKDGSVSEAGSAFIWKQNPEPGSIITPGQTIDIYLTQDTPQRCQ